MDKKTLRGEAIARRRAMTDLECQEKSAIIAETLLQMPEFAIAQRVLAYHALRNEVAPSAALRGAEFLAKSVFLPRVNGVLLSWRQVRFDTSPPPITPGPYGLYEPGLDAAELGPAVSSDLCLVPGVLFRSDGHRLGQGGGYFDRFLASFPGLSVGLAYDWQIDNTVPVEQHDIPVDIIVTELRVLVPGRERK